jgi:ATP-dependent RNA helicase DDX60
MSDSASDWYANIGAKYLDILGDYAGKERFFIEGDSLLLDCLSNEKLDFDPGFQLLHAIYLVEQYLYNLKRRHCTFDIVFFDDNSNLCIPQGKTSDASKYLLARQVVIKHFQGHADAVEVYVFTNSDDIRFAEYLQDSAVYFAICSDGASYKHSKQKTLNLQSHAIATGFRGSTLSINNLGKLRSNIHKLMSSHALDVALLNGLLWQDSKVFAFVLERKSRAQTVVLSVPTNGTHSTASVTNGQATIKADAISDNIPPKLQYSDIISIEDHSAGIGSSC